MSAQYARPFSRRQFLGGLTLAGTVGLTGLYPRPIAAEPPPETTRITLLQPPGICTAPVAVAEALLRAEGFSEVHYLPTISGVDASRQLAAGEADFSLAFAPPFAIALDRGQAGVLLSGIHVGCMEVVAREPLRTLRDLKGKRVAVWALGSVPHLFLAAMAAHVGMDPASDIQWVILPPNTHVEPFIEGKMDILIAFPPQAQELRARQIGHVVVAMATDRPWSQYFCCMVEGNREFVRQHPVATKRVLRALLKAADLCASEPQTAARLLVDKRQTGSYEYALQTMQELPYRSWRDFDPEDSLRFYALRFHEAKMIKSSPQKIIAQGTDWRFLNELKKEMKG
jgi:NitT/TauT family transport system substrate-binding protein